MAYGNPDERPPQAFYQPGTVVRVRMEGNEQGYVQLKGGRINVETFQVWVSDHFILSLIVADGSPVPFFGSLVISSL